MSWKRGAVARPVRCRPLYQLAFCRKIMLPFIWISIVFNVLLLLGLIAAVRLGAYERRTAADIQARQYEDFEHAIERVGNLSQLHCALASEVAATVLALRADIPRHYQYLEDDDLLARLASKLRREVAQCAGVVKLSLNADDARSIQARGGDVSDQNTMTLATILRFALRVHADAQQRAEQIAAIIPPPCGDHVHADWLAKSLAVYEGMCDSKEMAVQRLCAAIEAWIAQTPEDAARAVEDGRDQ